MIINGHAAAIQKEILEQICQVESNHSRKLLAVTVLFSDCGVGLGHAGLAETALMQSIRPQMVDIDKLPVKPEVLYYRDFGIADSGGSDRDFFVRYDPRDATPELGEQLIDFAVNRCIELMEQYFGE